LPQDWATRYLDTIHDFVMLNAFSETPAARAAMARANNALRKASIKRGKNGA
jgi:acetyl esterase